MTKNIDELLIGIVLVALMVISASFIINDAIAKNQLIAEQEGQIAALEAEVAELHHEVVVLTDQKEAVELDLAMVREENTALMEELCYLHYLLDDPMALFNRDVLELTPEDEELLMQIAMAEAGNQGVIGKMLVMRCVLNRCENADAGVRSIIYAPNQFYVAGMGGYDNECELALIMVEAGWDGSRGAVFFCSQGYNDCATEPLFRYLGHWFSK